MEENMVQEISKYLYKQSLLNLWSIAIYNKNYHTVFNIKIHYKLFKKRSFHKIPTPFLLIGTIIKLREKKMMRKNIHLQNWIIYMKSFLFPGYYPMEYTDLNSSKNSSTDFYF